MPKFFIEQKQIKQDKITIYGQDVNHIKKVLRAKKGEELEELIKHLIINILKKDIFER